MSEGNKVIIESSKTSILKSDFSSLKQSLSEVSFATNSKLKTIEESSFEGFSKLSYFSLENCLFIEIIPKRCFYSCTSLTTVILPEHGILSTLEVESFSYTSIASIILPPSVRYIKTGLWIGAFSRAYKLQRIEFYSTNGLENVGRDAFMYTSLIEFDIGPNLKYIEGVTFEEIGSSFVRFTTSGTNPNFCVVDNILYNKDRTILVCCPHGFVPKSICNTTQIIGFEAFHKSCIKHFYFLNKGIITLIEYCFYKSSIETIFIPETITKIGNNAFMTCQNLKSIIIPPVDTIENGVFLSCSNLKMIVISNGTRKIGNNTFENCKSIRELYIPSSVNEVSDATFKGASISRCGVHCPFDKRDEIKGWTGFSVTSFTECTEIKTIHYNCHQTSRFILYVFLFILS